MKISNFIFVFVLFKLNSQKMITARITLIEVDFNEKVSRKIGIFKSNN